MDGMAGCWKKEEEGSFPLRKRSVIPMKKQAAVTLRKRERNVMGERHTG